jgi:ATP synthase protein I
MRIDPQDKKKTNPFDEQLGKKIQRKQKALHNNKKSIWFGLGMIGVVGWSITVPTVLGASLGIWLDKNYPASFSWTLSFLIVGLFLGCIIAWNWVAKEDKEIHENKNEKDE